MKQQLQLHIPEPCHENWDNMSPTEQGRFCLSCRKEVVDFSLMSDKEILKYISTASSSICGRASEDQLARDIIQPTESRFSFKYFWSLLITSFLISNKSSAQIESPKEKTVLNPVKNKNRNEPPAVIRMGAVASIQQDVNVQLTGRVIDEHGKPIPFASVMLNGTKKGIATDSNGIFTLPATIESFDKIVLTASFVGFLRDTISLNNPNNIKDLQIQNNDIKIEVKDLQLKMATLGGVVVTSNTLCTRVGGLMAVRSIRYTYLDKIKDTLTGNRAIKVYPNPISRNSVFKIEFNLKEMGEYRLQCMDASGRVLQTRTLNIVYKNQLENFSGSMFGAAGTYFINVKGKAKTFSAKLLVQ